MKLTLGISKNILYILISIFICDESFTFGSNENIYFTYAKYAIYVYLFLYFLQDNLKRTKTDYRNEFYTILVISLLILISMFVNKQTHFGYPYRIFILFLTFLFVNKCTFREFAIIYLKAICFLSTISIVVYLANRFIPGIFSFFPHQYSKNGELYTNLYLTAIIQNGLRNSSIFREPGAFMIYIAFGMLIQLFYQKELNVRNFVVLCIAMITTLSTAGYILSLFLITIYIFTTEKRRKKNRLFLLVASSIFTIFIVLSPLLLQPVFNKLTGEFGDHGTTMARVASLIIPMEIWLSNPILGVGLSNVMSLFTDYSFRRFGEYLSEYEFTNTLTILYGAYGIFIGLFYTYSLFKFTKYFTQNKFTNILLFIFLVGALSNENLTYSLFINTVFMFGFRYHKENQQNTMQSEFIKTESNGKIIDNNNIKIIKV